MERDGTVKRGLNVPRMDLLQSPSQILRVSEYGAPHLFLREKELPHVKLPFDTARKAIHHDGSKRTNGCNRARQFLSTHVINGHIHALSPGPIPYSVDDAFFSGVDHEIGSLRFHENTFFIIPHGRSHSGAQRLRDLNVHVS